MVDAYYKTTWLEKFPVILRLMAHSTLQDGRWVVHSRVLLRTKISDAFFVTEVAESTLVVTDLWKMRLCGCFSRFYSSHGWRSNSYHFSSLIRVSISVSNCLVYNLDLLNTNQLFIDFQFLSCTCYIFWWVNFYMVFIVQHIWTVLHVRSTDFINLEQLEVSTWKSTSMSPLQAWWACLQYNIFPTDLLLHLSILESQISYYSMSALPQLIYDSHNIAPRQV